MIALEVCVDLKPTHESQTLGFMTPTGTFIRTVFGACAIIDGLYRFFVFDNHSWIMFEDWLNKEDHAWTVTVRDMKQRYAWRGTVQSIYGPWSEQWAY